MPVFPGICHYCCSTMLDRQLCVTLLNNKSVIYSEHFMSTERRVISDRHRFLKEVPYQITVRTLQEHNLPVTLASRSHCCVCHLFTDLFSYSLCCVPLHILFSISVFHHNCRTKGNTGIIYRHNYRMSCQPL